MRLTLLTKSRVIVRKRVSRRQPGAGRDGPGGRSSCSAGHALHPVAPGAKSARVQHPATLKGCAPIPILSQRCWVYFFWVREENRQVVVDPPLGIFIPESTSESEAGYPDNQVGDWGFKFRCSVFKEIHRRCFLPVSVAKFYSCLFSIFGAKIKNCGRFESYKLLWFCFCCKFWNNCSNNCYNRIYTVGNFF